MNPFIECRKINKRSRFLTELIQLLAFLNELSGFCVLLRNEILNFLRFQKEVPCIQLVQLLFLLESFPLLLHLPAVLEL